VSQADLVLRNAVHEAAVHPGGTMSVELLTKVHAAWAAMSLVLVAFGATPMPAAKKKPL